MPAPVSREFLCGLKAKKLEEKRIRDLNDRINHIYRRTIESAELYSHTFYRFQITQHNNGSFSIPDMFYKENMKDMLIGLRAIFPECVVTHINVGSATESIMIDWT